MEKIDIEDYKNGIVLEVEKAIAIAEEVETYFAKSGDGVDFLLELAYDYKHYSMLYEILLDVLINIKKCTEVSIIN